MEMTRAQLESIIRMVDDFVDFDFNISNSEVASYVRGRMIEELGCKFPGEWRPMQYGEWERLSTDEPLRLSTELRDYYNLGTDPVYLYNNTSVKSINGSMMVAICFAEDRNNSILVNFVDLEVQA